jgi:hypothetical protein
MKTTIKTSETKQPALTRAVLRSLGGRDDGQLEDIARHGADAGWPGFTYYSDTVAFFKAYRKDIAARVKAVAEEIGEQPVTVVSGFNCLRPASGPADAETLESIGRCLYGARLTNDDTQVANALAWFALEEIARELNPDL